MRLAQTTPHLDTGPMATEGLMRFARAVRLAFVLGWADALQRYARSVIGHLWITIHLLIFTVLIGVTFAGIFGQDPRRYLPYFAVSYVGWTFLSNLLIETTGAMTAATGNIRDRGHDPLIFILVPMARGLITMAHTIIIPIVALLLFWPVPLSNVVMAVPGVVLFLLVCLAACLPIAVAATRYRDIRLILEALLLGIFLMTPILWEPSTLKNRPQFIIVELNPIYHLITIWREPLLYGTWPTLSFAWVFVILAGLVALNIRALRRLRHTVLWL
jgi:lipopolysaccharide transport system permease protein